MENISDLQAGYQEHLFNSFEKIKKHLSKKHNQIRDMITTYSEQIKTDKECNANKYFGVYKLSIETKDTKLVETSIYFIHKLISHGFLDGNCRDSVANLHLEENKGKTAEIPTSEKRKLIDSIVESICSCKDEKNENVQLQIIKVLLTIVTSVTCEVHGKSLQEIIRTLFTIHLTSKNNVNQTTAKAALTQIINAIFQRMEEHNLKNNKALEDDYKARRKTASSITPVKTNQNHNNLSIVRHNSVDLGNQDGAINPYPTLSVNTSLVSPTEINLTKENDKSPLRRETVTNVSITQNIGDVLATETGESKPAALTETQERYVSRMVQNLVDDVCLFHGKKEAILKKYEGQEDQENLKFELENIPLRAVPLVLNPDDPKYRALLRVPNLENEAKTPAGYFGWCFVCRGPADLYCKDTRIPICSIECKLKHLDEIDFMTLNGNIDYTSKNIYLHDACQIFNYLCKISGRDPANNMTPTVLKNKTLALELILSIMDNPGHTFTSRKEFKDIIKDHLCDSILKNSVSTDRPVFAYSLGIFVSLVNQFREHLKSEIAVFIDSVFLKMLESGNSSYHHRLLALQVFYKIMSKPRTVLELFVNYDCDVKSTNITEKIIEILTKIAQGKYLRSEYSTVINPQQEPTLKVLALESLVNLVKSLAQFQEDYRTKAMIEKAEEKEKEEGKEGDGSFEAEDPKETTMFEKADEIEKSRMLKTELQKAIQKFGFKIKLGMKYFAQLGLINPDDPVSIGKFFFKTPNLSKEKLGEYFGEEPEFYIKALTAYTECFDVRGMSLDDALRVYLSTFYLPGEGQKIDRIMQVFAGKYYADNPTGIFKSASAAYTAAFLFIMLQTDAHNPQIKEQDRMKLPAFVKIAKGINDGENLPEEELAGFYSRIVKTPLALVDSEKAKKNAAEASTHSLKKKEEQFKLESEKMIEEGQELIKKKLESQFFVVAGPEYTKSLFTEVIWGHVFAVFTLLFEQFEDPKIIQLCLEGLSNCIKLSGHLNMNTERDTFVSSFAKMTNLTTNREIKEKNAKCIKSLLQTALTHGQLLRSSWKYVLECISRIDHYLHYTSNRESDPFAVDSSKLTKNEQHEHIEAFNSEAVKQVVDPNLIHNIFNRSNTFELEEIVEFITCLCKISEDELKNPSGVSIYSLQKLVEVAHFNIDRIKFIWSQIWNIMREHISNVAITSIPEVSLFAVDSLKQLSIKFLKKDEFASLEFQKEFLKPFETIFEKVHNDYIKDLVLNCINYIISHVMKNIKSGWKTILDILSLSAESEKETLIQLSFDIVEKIIKENLDAMKDVISDLSLLLLKFAKNKQENIAKLSLEYFSKLVDQIIINHKSYYSDEEVPENLEMSSSIKKDSKTNLVFGIAESAWINILTSLYTLSSDPRRLVNTKATVIIFDILIKYGADFSHDFWTNIMGGVIKPLFDEIQFSFQSKKVSAKDLKDKDTQASKDFSTLAFGKIIELYNKYYDHLSFFTNDIFNILLNCILNPSEVLAKISLSALKDIIARSYKNYQAQEWEKLIELFSRICKSTIPLQLMDQQIINKKAKKPAKFNADECVTQCVVQLQMVGVIKEIISNYFDFFTDEQIGRIIEVLLRSAKFAREFNDQIYLRFCLWKSGFMKEMTQLPGLLKQEKEGFIGYITVLHKLYTRTTDPEKAKQLLDQLLDFGIDLMKMFCQKNEDLISIRHEMVNAEAVNKDNSEKADANIDDDYESVSINLRSTETERDIINMRTVLSSFIPKLALLKPEELLPRLRELTNSLVNISFFYVPKSLYPLEGTQGNQKITDLGSDETVNVIRTLLNKYFDYTFSFIKS